jgi:predicted Rossmann-fold nucleotide-binding protein
VNGFYNALIAQLDHAVQEGFLPPQHRAKLIICQNISEIYTAINNLKMPVSFVI